MLRNVITSCIGMAGALFFLMLGVVSILLPWSPKARTDFIQFILEDSLAISLFGLGLITVGIGIAINIIMGARRKYYHLRSGSRSILIDETLIQDYINAYWKQIFPKNHVSNRLTLHKNKIHLVADLPYIPIGEQKQLLERIKNDLAEHFSNFLGYRQSFYLRARFQSENKEFQPKNN